MLANARGLCRRSCIQKVADYGGPGTAWASQTVPITSIEASGFQLFADHALTQAQSIRKRYEGTRAAKNKLHCRHRDLRATQRDSRVELRRFF